MVLKQDRITDFVSIRTNISKLDVISYNILWWRLVDKPKIQYKDGVRGIDFNAILAVRLETNSCI